MGSNFQVKLNTLFQKTKHKLHLLGMQNNVKLVLEKKLHLYCLLKRYVRICEHSEYNLKVMMKPLHAGVGDMAKISYQDFLQAGSGSTILSRFFFIWRFKTVI